MSNKYDVTYQTDNFEDWHKHFYGTPYTGQSLTKPENMSDADWDYGKALQTGYQNTQRINNFYDTSTSLLNQHYSTAQNTANQNKAVAQQNASVAYDKLKKYLPTQLKAQGLGGLGVSETASLQALNNYSTEMGKIDSDYTSEMTKLDQAYGEQLTSFQQERDERLYDANRDATGNLLTDNVLKEYEAKEEVELKEDRNAFSNEGRTVIGGFISSGDFASAEKYLEDNKTLFGETAYQAYKSEIGVGRQTTAKNTHSSAIDTFLATNYSSVSARKAAFDQIMSDLEEAKGELGDVKYNDLVAKMNSLSSGTCNGGWFIQGLGSGREDDDIDITIGSTKRGGNGAKEFDLLCGTKVTDGSIIKELNKLATGDENGHPDNNNEGAWINTNVSSYGKPGKIVVYMNQMFIYTTKGWRVVKADNEESQLQDAINAFLANSGSAASTSSTSDFPIKSTNADSDFSTLPENMRTAYQDFFYDGKPRTSTSNPTGSAPLTSSNSKLANYLK